MQNKLPGNVCFSHADQVLISAGCSCLGCFCVLELEEMGLTIVAMVPSGRLLPMPVVYSGNPEYGNELECKEQ